MIAAACPIASGVAVSGHDVTVLADEVSPSRLLKACTRRGIAFLREGEARTYAGIRARDPIRRAEIADRDVEPRAAAREVPP